MWGRSSFLTNQLLLRVFFSLSAYVRVDCVNVSTCGCAYECVIHRWRTIDSSSTGDVATTNVFGESNTLSRLSTIHITMYFMDRLKWVIY